MFSWFTTIKAFNRRNQFADVRASHNSNGQLEQSHAHAISMVVQLSERKTQLDHMITQLQEERRQNAIVLEQYTVMRERFDKEIGDMIEASISLDIISDERIVRVAAIKEW